MLASAALLAMSHAWAQDVELLVRHSQVSTGLDGVKRSTEFSERVIRRSDSIWVSRVLPTASPEHHEHAATSKQHKHLDVTTASRWITRAADGTLTVRIVPNDEKVVVTVGKADYGNIGFDGSWAAAYNLIDPAVLERMQTGGVTGDLTTYTRRQKDRDVTVLWNRKLQIPVLVETVDGSSSRKTVVQVLSRSAARPWDKFLAAPQKDYSDYLD
uniref:hypothetical protein n=1 Tax=uncultured Acidovorax sp. TaxID=158751 RepID=UPI00076A1A39|nr:hypothetical protein [uncultured Acidovorax sp.]